MLRSVWEKTESASVQNDPTDETPLKALFSFSVAQIWSIGKTSREFVAAVLGEKSPYCLTAVVTSEIRLTDASPSINLLYAALRLIGRQIKTPKVMRHTMPGCGRSKLYTVSHNGIVGL